MSCPSDSVATFKKSIGGEIWRVDALLVTEAVLSAIIVGIGAYGQRYRHHPFTRFIFLGATTLFLPIVSSVVSTITKTPHFVNEIGEDVFPAFVATCAAFAHFSILIIWAFLLQIVMVNTSTVAAAEDREGRSAGPPVDLIVQGLWTLYLGFTIEGHDLLVVEDYFDFFRLLGAPFSLLCAKIVLKYYAFEKARQSFALGRNPGLTFVYMEKLQLQEANRHHQHSEEPQVAGSDAPPPPPLLVTREEVKRVEIQPHGYAFKDDSGTMFTNNAVGLVTFDKIWMLEDSMLPISTPHHKGLCLSFALFKLLRCRFSRYKLTNAGSMGTLAFFRSFSLQPGEHDRIFRVIADEISFAHDYYYSSLPISYAKCCLPILNILLSLLTIGYSLWSSVPAISYFLYPQDDHQIYCHIQWIQSPFVADCTDYSSGSFFIDMVLLLLLLALVLIVEVRCMVSYICSDWTKVSLICRYVNHASSQHSLCMKEWVLSLLLRCRCKFMMKHWDEKMSQCSVLVRHQRTTLLDFIRGLIPFQDQKWKVKVTAPVKVCIIDALRGVIDGGLSNGAASLRRSQVGESFLWACEGKDTSETILLWHIATCILQLKPPHRRHHRQGCTPTSMSAEKQIAAVQLSQDCAYLVSCYPELLPDNNAWCKSLYKAVKKDTKRVVAECTVPGSSTLEYDERVVTDEHHAEESSTPEDERPIARMYTAESSTREAEYQKLLQLLSANSNHEVIKNGVKLGKQLVEATLASGEEETVWKLLAGFWSELVLYIAPSDNLNGHKEAIARGGELITLLWALLFHAGIVSRPCEEDGTGATTSASAV